MRISQLVSAQLRRNMFAVRTLGSRARAASQSGVPETKWLERFQLNSLAYEREYKQLATMPWLRGRLPVKSVACDGQVKLGNGSRNGYNPPAAASARRFGVCSDTSAEHSAATSTTNI